MKPAAQRVSRGAVPLCAGLLVALAACGSTEPVGPDGRFDVAITGALRQSVSGTAIFEPPGLGLRTVTMSSPVNPATGRSDWQIRLSIAGYVDPVAGAVITLDRNPSYAALTGGQTASAFVSWENASSIPPAPRSWNSQTGELRLTSVSATGMSGTFSFEATRPTNGAAETLTVRGSFSAVCPSDRCRP